MKLRCWCLALLVCGFCGTAFADATLRPGDTFDLRIGGVPGDEMAAISSSYTLDGEGYLNLPYLGKLQVSGMNAGQIQSMVERAYTERGIFTHPTITLTIAPSARFVNVGGQVKAPSRIPYTPDMTVFSAINAAGDFTEFAAQTKVRLMRGDKVIVINCKKIRSDPSQDVKVLPGDAIQVPEAFF
jgi:protein involved in polysaccharide export with SLBB domain